MKKRLLAFLLALSIAVSMLAAPASAAGNNTAVQFAITLGAMDADQSGALNAAVTRGAFAKMLTSYSTFRESVSFLLSGAVDYEFRTTVVRELHDGDSFRDIGPWLSGARRYYLQRFVDRDTVLRAGLHPWERESLEGFAALVRPWVEQVELRGG